MQGTKVDTSLGERQGIRHLLERVKGEEVSLGELEEIAHGLKRAGEKALRPLIRELWRERKGELISKYAYVLDFFDRERWLDQLIRIALKRRDLGEDGKAALQVALREAGVDLTLPPFRGIFSAGFSLEETLKKRSGSDGVVRFVDDFLSYSSEIQQLILREMPTVADANSIRILEAMLWHEEPSIVEGALTALGRIRDPLSAAVLKRYLEEGSREHRESCGKNLRRLLFLRVAPPVEPPPLPFHQGYASAPDGDGYRSLFLTRWVAPGRVNALYMQVHERRGLLAAWGGDALTLDEFQSELEAFGTEEELHRVDPAYVVELVADALHWSRDLAYLPADFYLQRSLFRGADLAPRPYRPDLSAVGNVPVLSYQQGEEVTADFLADPFFSNWFMADDKVYDFAAEHGTGEEVLELFCAELVAPQVDVIRQRLLASADLMLRCGRDRYSVARVVALARSLEEYRLPLHLHPFLSTFALESLEAAAGALSGYEPAAQAGQQE